MKIRIWMFIPDVLVASDARSLSALIERSIRYDAAKQPKNFFGISQIFDPGYKSFQKIEVLKGSLKQAGYTSANLTINSIPGLENRPGFPATPGKNHWVLQGSRRSSGGQVAGQGTRAAGEKFAHHVLWSRCARQGGWHGSGCLE